MSDEYEASLSRARHQITCAACLKPIGDVPMHLEPTATYHRSCAEPLLEARARTHRNPDLRELLSYNRGVLPSR